MDNKAKYMMCIICLKELLKRGLLTLEEYKNAENEMMKIYPFNNKVLSN